jgi:hypothetical protein
MRNTIQGVLKCSKEVRSIINTSIRLYRQGNLEYCYVYTHSIGGVITYIGAGSGDRVIRMAGRSMKWYDTFLGKEVAVSIVSSLLPRRNAEKLESSLIKQQPTCINERVLNTILRFDRQGNLEAEYEEAIQVEKDGYKGSLVIQCCKGTRGLHLNKHWMYRENYERFGFTFKAAINHAQYIEQVDRLTGIVIRKLLTAQAFEQFGYSPKVIQQVCTGHKKTHLGFQFRYCK